MAGKHVGAPWPTLNGKIGGFRGLTTLISNDPTVGLSWLAFYAANYPSLMGKNVSLFTTADTYIQSHKVMTIRGTRRGDERTAVFLHEEHARNPGTITCVALDSRGLDRLEEQLHGRADDFIILDLEGFDLKAQEALDLYYRLDKFTNLTGVPTVVASRGPGFGEENTYIQAMTLFDATQVWVRRGAMLLPPDGQTLDMRVFRRGQLVCSITTRSNDEVGDFSELR